MEASASSVTEEFSCHASFQIPYDLFVSKKHKVLGSGGYLRFTDSSGNLVYKVERKSQNKSTHTQHSRKLLLDASGDCLISLHQVDRGSWRGYKGTDSSDSKDLIFRAERIVNELIRTEFEIFPNVEDGKDSKSDFKMKGSPFKRSCTIYKGNSIMAETSLMYKLGIKKIFVPRNRFRVTLFPGFIDHSLAVALVVIFFDGRKFWI